MQQTKFSQRLKCSVKGCLFKLRYFVQTIYLSLHLRMSEREVYRVNAGDEAGRGPSKLANSGAGS